MRANSDAWRERAWAAANLGNQAIRNEVAAALTRLAARELAADEPLVDIGCGTGWWLERLLGQGVSPERLHGIERDPTRVSATKARVPGITVHRGDARRLPWPDEFFAAGFLLLVLSSAGNRVAVASILAEARRVIQPSGIVLVWEPTIPTPANRRTRRIGLAELRAGLDAELESEPVTVLPPLARRLGAHTARLYPALSRLRTHRLVLYRRPD